MSVLVYCTAGWRELIDILIDCYNQRVTVTALTYNPNNYSFQSEDYADRCKWTWNIKLSSSKLKKVSSWL